MRQSNTGHPLVYQYNTPRIGHYYRVAIRRRDEVITKHFSYGDARTQQAALRQALQWRDEQVKLNPITTADGRPRNRGLPIGVSLGVTHYDSVTGIPTGYGFRVNCRDQGKQVQKEFRIGLAGEITLSHYRMVRREVLKFFQMTRAAEAAGHQLDLNQLAIWVRAAIRDSKTNVQRHARKSISGETVERNRLMVERAENLLRSTNLTVKEIAVRAGYAGRSAFIVWWQKKHGSMSPLLYRKQQQAV